MLGPHFVLGVTGAIGAGKSTVCRLLLAHGFSILDMDDVAAAAVVEVLPEVAQKVPAVLSARGALNHDKEPLFAAMLENPALRNDLERLLKPLLLRCIRQFIKDLKGPGVLDAALLFEAELDAFCDATLCVMCSREERRRRVLLRTSASAKHFEALEKAQWSEEQKGARSSLSISTEIPQALLPARLAGLVEALRPLGLSS